MRLAEVRNIIHQVIAEVKKEKTEAKKKPKTEKKPEVKSKMGSNLPKSSGKLADLKQEMKVLKQMKESLGQLQITEGDDSQFVAEYAHMQKYVNELESIKSAHTKLSEMLDNQIEQVNERIQSETAKVKEMMGLGDKLKIKDEAKKTKKVAKKDDKVNEGMESGNPDQEFTYNGKSTPEQLIGAAKRFGFDIYKMGKGNRYGFRGDIKSTKDWNKVKEFFKTFKITDDINGPISEEFNESFGENDPFYYNSKETGNPDQEFTYNGDGTELIDYAKNELNLDIRNMGRNKYGIRSVKDWDDVESLFNMYGIKDIIIRPKSKRF
jgi:hypothetical protein